MYGLRSLSCCCQMVRNQQTKADSLRKENNFEFSIFSQHPQKSCEQIYPLTASIPSLPDNRPQVKRFAHIAFFKTSVYTLHL